eukprot:gene1705-5901_t
MAYGIGQQLDDAGKLSIKELVQLQSVDPSLIYTLALQEKQKLQAAASNQEALGMQTIPSTITSQMEGRMPGVQQAAARTAPRPQMAQGISANPAQNMQAVGAAQGGIIGYAEGGATQDPNSEEAQRQRYLQLKAAEAQAIQTGNQLALQNIRRELRNYEGSTAAQAPAPTPENTDGMAGGGIVSLAKGGFPDLSGDGKVTRKDILMGRGVVGKQEGGIVGFATGDLVGGFPEGEDSLRGYTGLLDDQYYINGQLVSEAAYIDSKRKNVEVEEFKDFNLPRDAKGVADAMEGMADSYNTAMMPKITEAMAESYTDEQKGRPFLDKLDEVITDVVRQRPSQEARDAASDVMAQPFASIAEEEKVKSDRALATASRPPSFVTALEEDKAAKDKQATEFFTALMQENANKPAGGRQVVAEEVEEVDKDGKSKLEGFMDVLEILGRGAGASKGFEGSKILEETREIEQAEADRAARREEQQMVLDARSLELDARNKAAIGLELGKYAASLTDIAIMASAEYQQLEKKLREEFGEGPFNLKGDGLGFFSAANEAEVERLLAAQIPRIREDLIKTYQRLLSQYNGTGGQSSAGGQGGITDVVEEFSEYQPSGQ